MLVAYAIENLCKGRLVRNKTDHVWSSAAEKGMIPSDVIGHDLSYLLRSVNFPLQHGDEELAFRLKRSSVWAARYPVPRKADHPTLKFKMPSGEEIVPAWYKEDDLQIVKEFFLLYQINLRLDPEQGTTIPFHLGTCPHPASIASSIRRQSSASIV